MIADVDLEGGGKRESKLLFQACRGFPASCSHGETGEMLSFMDRRAPALQVLLHGVPLLLPTLCSTLICSSWTPREPPRTISSLPCWLLAWFCCSVSGSRCPWELPPCRSPEWGMGTPLAGCRRRAPFPSPCMGHVHGKPFVLG